MYETLQLYEHTTWNVYSDSVDLSWVTYFPDFVEDELPLSQL